MAEFRLPPKSTSERVSETNKLIEVRGSDLVRWSEMSNLAVSWDSRAHRAASYIPDGTYVLDLGCGAMALRSFLKPNCSYLPADLVARSTDCLVIDLNRKEFPASRFDWIAMLGVLEYIHDLAWPLSMAREHAERMVVTYCCDTSGNISYRRGLGWVNDLTMPDFAKVLEATGWLLEDTAIDKIGANNTQMMFVCRPKAACT